MSRFQRALRPLFIWTLLTFPKVAARDNYGGQLSLVSEVFVLITRQVLSMQYSVTPSWKMVQRLKFHPDWFPGAPVEVNL
jgi:hypothetical protein